MENDKVIEQLHDISTDAIYCITIEESEAIKTSIKAIEKLEKIENIVERVESLHPDIAIGDREGIRKIREVLNG